MDMSQIENVILRIQELLQEDRVGEAIALIEALRPADQADLFEELTPEQQHDLLPISSRSWRMRMPPR
jgi:Mg/Co/Ni transporter MgtE